MQCKAALWTWSSGSLKWNVLDVSALKRAADVLILCSMEVRRGFYALCYRVHGGFVETGRLGDAFAKLVVFAAKEQVTGNIGEALCWFSTLSLSFSRSVSIMADIPFCCLITVLAPAAAHI